VRNKSFFGANISPSCSYCKIGTVSKDGTVILCKKKGIVGFDFSCEKFQYCPLKRVPKHKIEMPKYDSSSFTL